MAKQITVEVPHHLSQDQAKARIISGVDKGIESFGNRVANVSHKWTGNTLAFSVTAMGQTLTGAADVLPQSVKITIDLPWALAMFGGTLKNRVEQQTRAALEDAT